MFSPGQEIGLYTLVKRIGRGGFGEVWLAERRAKFVTTRVAVKLPLDDHIDREEVKREAVLWAHASGHPNVLPIIDADEYDGQVVIVSEYSPDGSLHDYLGRKGPLPVREALDMTNGILNGLEFLHAKQIIHRDLKPANILLQGRTPRLADFGISRVMKAVSVTESMSGTPLYMAPEAFDRKRTEQTDIWSVGVILFQMLNGSLPYPYGNLTDLYGAIVRGQPEPLSDAISPDLQAAVLKALAKDPGERYRSAAEMRSSLNSYLAGVAHHEHLATAPDKDQHAFRPVAATLHSAAPFSTTAEYELTIRDGNDLAVPTGNLTGGPAGIVGREKEIAELRQLLRHENTRLITMTGIGGTGKTTLARAVAKASLDDFPDGVFFVEMATTINADLVAAVIAQSLGARESGTRPVIEILKDHLKNKCVLLVIDNFEQVTGAASQLAELAAVPGGLKVLVTSRNLLHVNAEHEFHVPALALPPDTSRMAPEELSTCEAVRLFVERARRVRSNFTLTAENGECVAAICVRVDCLPLAIELAAARIKMLSPQAILAKLENRLTLLTGGAADLPARQQTMRGAVQWSYDLLAETEKDLFRLLSVFEGGFTIDAAEAVVHDASAGKLSDDVLDGMTSLVDKSLLVSKERPNGEYRFRMLQVVREYARECFEAASETARVNESHADYYLAMAEEAEPHLLTPQYADWLVRLEDDHDNFRVALRWSFENDVGMAARFAAALRNFWAYHNYLLEGRKWLDAALERGRIGITTPVHFKLLNGAGWFAKQQGDYQRARTMYEAALSESRSAKELPQIALSTRGLGMIAIQQGDFAAARGFIEEGLEISRHMDDRFGIAHALIVLGDLERMVGNNVAARASFETSLGLARELGDQRIMSCNLNNLGFVACDDGDLAAAETHLAEALGMVQELGYKIQISYSMDGFAAIAAERGDMEKAATLAGAADALRTAIGGETEPVERRFRESYLGRLKAKLDPEGFDPAYERGNALRLEEAVALCQL